MLFWAQARGWLKKTPHSHCLPSLVWLILSSWPFLSMRQAATLWVVWLLSLSLKFRHCFWIPRIVFWLYMLNCSWFNAARCHWATRTKLHLFLLVACKCWECSLKWIQSCNVKHLNRAFRSFEVSKSISLQFTFSNRV